MYVLPDLKIMYALDYRRLMVVDHGERHHYLFAVPVYICHDDSHIENTAPGEVRNTVPVLYLCDAREVVEITDAVRCFRHLPAAVELLGDGNADGSRVILDP